MLLRICNGVTFIVTQCSS